MRLLDFVDGMETLRIARAKSLCIGRAAEAWSFEFVQVNLSWFQFSGWSPANITLSGCPAL